MLAASSVEMPGQESGADGGDRMIEECFLTIGGEKSAKVVEFYICTDEHLPTTLCGICSTESAVTSNESIQMLLLDFVLVLH